VNRIRSRCAVALTLVLVTSALCVRPSVSLAADRTFPLNFKRVQLTELIERVAIETRRPILFDDRVRGSVSIVVKRPVTEAEAWSILNASLSMLGFSLVPSTADQWRISKISEVVGEAPFKATVDATNESFVTTLIPLATADLSAVMKVLEPLSGARVTLVPFEPTHSLIATGPERDIARLTTIADELDRVQEFELHLRVLRYRGVDEVGQIVDARLASTGLTDRRLQVWSDERTNTMLFRGEAEEVARFERFLDRVDQPVEGDGQIRVLRVLNRDPEEMADLIRALGQGDRSTDVVSEAVARGSELAGANFVVSADKASRSLVVIADPMTQIAIRHLLEQLDEPPQLISVDITISELRTPRNYALGFGFTLPFSTGNNSDDLAGLIVSSPTPGAFLGRPSPQSRIFGRISRDSGVPFPIDGGDAGTIPILQTGTIDGGEFRARNEVLLKPNLIVTAGEQHEIFVGNNFPVPVTETDESGNASTGGLPAGLARTTRFDRTDIGILLEIEARAGRVGKIQLDLNIDVSSLVPSVAGPIEEVGPTFLHQNVDVTARLEDGETAIIAVNKQKSELEGMSGVPWLSDIPFLGYFFSTEFEQAQDTRLVVAARARRMSSPSELVADSIRRRLAFERFNARGKTMPTAEGPPYGVLVTTREREDDAITIADGFTRSGYRAVVHHWSHSEVEYYDVYIVSLASMSEAAEVAVSLAEDGWEADLVVLPTKS
jgi:general secretion pathway protein D